MESSKTMKYETSCYEEAKSVTNLEVESIKIGQMSSFVSWKRCLKRPVHSDTGGGRLHGHCLVHTELFKTGQLYSWDGL